MWRRGRSSTKDRRPRRICRAIAQSGLEPQGFVDNFFTTAGVSSKTGLAVEFRCLVFALHMFAVVDRLCLPYIACAEHLSRQTLQIMKATRRSPRSPDFDGPEAYLLHLGAAVSGVRTPAFDKYITEVQRNDAYVLKQQRLTQEEEAAVEKRASGGGGGRGAGGGGRGGGGGGRGEGDGAGGEGKVKKERRPRRRQRHAEPLIAPAHGQAPAGRDTALSYAAGPTAGVVNMWHLTLMVATGLSVSTAAPVWPPPVLLRATARLWAGEMIRPGGGVLLVVTASPLTASASRAGTSAHGPSVGSLGFERQLHQALNRSAALPEHLSVALGEH